MINFHLQLINLKRFLTFYEKFTKEFPQAKHFIILCFKCLSSYDLSIFEVFTVIFSVIWYHLFNLKNVKNAHGGVFKACNITKSNTPPWTFFMFFKLYKWYQIVQSIAIFTNFISVWWMVNLILMSSPVVK